MTGPEGFKNGIPGLDKVDIQSPVQENTEKPASILAPKVKKSIDNRKAKIEKLFAELKSASTPDTLQEFIIKRKKLEELTRLLTRQEEVLSKESQESLARVYADTILAVGDFGSIVVPKLIKKEPFVQAEAISKLEELIRSLSGERPIAAGATQQEDITVTQPEEPIGAEKPPTFDGVNTVEELVKRLRSTPNWETEFVESKKRWVKTNQELAELIEKKVERFGSMKTDENLKAGDKEQKIREFVMSFVNPSLREAVRRVFVALGLLPAYKRPEPAPSERTVIPSQGQEAVGQEKSVVEKTAPAIEGVLLKRIIADLSSIESIGAIREKRIVAIEGKEIAQGIRRLNRDFQSVGFKNLPKEKQTKEVLDSIDILTTNDRLRADLQAAFREIGILEGVVSQSRTSLPQDKETARESVLGPATNEFLADLRRSIEQAERDAKQDTKRGVAYVELVRRFQYFGGQDFKKKSIKERQDEIAKFIIAFPENLREKAREVIAKDRIIEDTSSATSHSSPAIGIEADARPTVHEAKTASRVTTSPEELSSYDRLMAGLPTGEAKGTVHEGLSAYDALMGGVERTAQSAQPPRPATMDDIRAGYGAKKTSENPLSATGKVASAQPEVATSMDGGESAAKSKTPLWDFFRERRAKRAMEKAQAAPSVPPQPESVPTPSPSGSQASSEVVTVSATEQTPPPPPAQTSSEKLESATQTVETTTTNEVVAVGKNATKEKK